MSVQRWEHYTDTGMQPHPTGEWVRYEDHAAALAEYREALSRAYGVGHEDGMARAAKPRTLTALDDEPAVGSVVLVNGVAYQRMPYPLTPWHSPNAAPWAWPGLLEVGRSTGVTLIHDGGDR